MVHRNPPTAVDVIIELYNNTTFEGVVLIERKNFPYGWAWPGGFQEWGESLEQTAIREATEETGLDIIIVHQLKTYSDPDRDPRGHVNAIGFVARAHGHPCEGDDAACAKVFALDKIPYPLAFDHKKRLDEYIAWRQND